MSFRIRRRTVDERRAVIGAVAHGTLGVDRFGIVAEHAEGNLACPRARLGAGRTAGFFAIRSAMDEGRAGGRAVAWHPTARKDRSVGGGVAHDARPD